MKITHLKYVAITAFAISPLLMGCSEDVNISEFTPSLESEYFYIYPRDFKFDSRMNTLMGYIESDNAWAFSDVPEWLYVTPDSGNSDADFSVKATTNKSVSNREAIFYVSTTNTALKLQRTLTASQTGASPYVTFPEYDSSTTTVEGKSGQLIIGVDTNIPDLTARFTEPWATASYNEEVKTVTVEIQANETNISRKGTLTVSSTKYSAIGRLTITQLASGVTVMEDGELKYEADGGSQTRTIKSDLPWTAKTDNSWIDFSPKSGNAGETSVTITALPSYQSDTRTGQVYFYFGETEKKYIDVTQAGRYINLTPDAITLSAEENSSDKVVIDSNIGWEVSACPEWLSLSQDKGDAGNSTVTVTAQKNNSLNSRSGTISIKDSKSGGITQSVTVVQNGLDFGDQTTLEFSWHQSSLPLEIPLPGAWSAAVSDGWITMSQYTGTGATTCDITVSRNDSPDVRTGEIVFTSEGKSMSINIVQNGQYINIESTSGEAPALGTTLELYFSSSVDITPSIEYTSDITDWIIYEKVSDNTYSLTVKFNPSIKQRSASFILMPKDEDVKDELINGVKYNISQLGRDLRVEPSRITLFARGGTTETYGIQADGSYSIVKSEDQQWFNLVHNSDNNTYYVVVTENNTSVPRSGIILVNLTDLPMGEAKQIDIPICQMANGDITIIIDDFNNPEVW